MFSALVLTAAVAAAQSGEPPVARRMAALEARVAALEAAPCRCDKCCPCDPPAAKTAGGYAAFRERIAAGGTGVLAVGVTGPADYHAPSGFGGFADGLYACSRGPTGPVMAPIAVALVRPKEARILSSVPSLGRCITDPVTGRTVCPNR